MNPHHKRQLALALWRIRHHLIAGRIKPDRFWRLTACLLSEHRP